MMKLKLADDLALPATAVTQTFGILAVRGAGKSNTAAVMAEEMFEAGLPFVVVDPVGSWFGLRSSADGKQPGLPIPIFGGQRGDLPLERGAGELLADLVTSKRLSCVLDLSTFESEAAKKDFLLAFARRLYTKNADPLHLFLEEADDYIPQKPMRDEAQLLRAWENIVRRGRARGLGITLITQRSAAISKMVLTQIETLVAMRTTSPQDRAAIEAWVKYHQVREEVLESLASLKTGEAWVWSPHFLGTMKRVQIRRRRTFDSAATPGNLRGDQPRKAATLADVDLAAVKVQMAATIERAKADDPRELRRQIAELRAQLAQKNKTLDQVDVQTKRIEEKLQRVKTVEKFVLKDGQLARAEQLVERIATAIAKHVDRFDALVTQYEAKLDAPLGELARVRDDITDAISATRAAAAKPPMKSIQRVERRPVPPSPHGRRAVPGATAARPASVVAPDGRLPPGEKATLIAAAQYPDGVARDQLSVLTGYKRSSRDAYILRLSARGYVTLNGNGTVHATDDGIAALGDAYEPLPEGNALQRWWLDRLPPGEKAVLEATLHAYPGVMERAALDDATGYKRSSRDAYIQRLMARRLVTADRGAVRAADTLFG